MQIYQLSQEERDHLNRLVDHVADQYDTAEDETFVVSAKKYSAELPKGLREYLYGLVFEQKHYGVALVRGFELDAQLPATPLDWDLENSYKPNFRSDYLAIIMSSILGEPFGFETQQTGKLIHDILPVKGREYHQEGCSSLEPLNFHTEDVFHPFRADYICLACLRNPSNVGTLVAGVRDFEFPEPLKQILFQNRFLHLTDNTHSEELSEPELLPILFGNQTSPYIRFDADFSVAQKGDSEAEHAIQYLHKQIQIHALEVDVEVGDFYFLDNYKWLHGRKPFRAHYDGKDRWIRRFNVKKDLKEAVNYRRSNNCRMLSAEPVVVE